MLYRNPAELVQLPREARKEMKALTSEEASRFLAALNGDRCAALFALALTTGMRPEEYLGLQWTDVDLAQATVTVRRALWSGERKAAAGTSPNQRHHAPAEQSRCLSQWSLCSRNTSGG